MFETDLKPNLIVIAGISGSGKSTIGRRLSDRMRIKISDVDSKRRQLYPEWPHIPVTIAHLSPDLREDLAQRSAHKAAQDEVEKELAQGNSTGLTQTFKSPGAHQLVERLRLRQGANLYVVQLKISEQTAIERVTARDPLQHSVSRAEQVKKQIEEYFPYPNPRLVINTEHYSPEEAAELIYQNIQARPRRLRRIA